MVTCLIAPRCCCTGLILQFNFFDGKGYFYCSYKYGILLVRVGVWEGLGENRFEIDPM